MNVVQQQIIDLWLSGKSRNKIAKELNMSPSLVWSTVLESGFATRTTEQVTEYRKLKTGTHHYCKDCGVLFKQIDSKSVVQCLECKIVNRNRLGKGRLSKYGLSEQEFQKLYSNQSGICAICGGVDKGKELAIDHDHKTGKVRGLLCSRCNQGLGLFRDNSDLLTKAVLYLMDREQPHSERVVDNQPTTEIKQ